MCGTVNNSNIMNKTWNPNADAGEINFVHHFLRHMVPSDPTSTSVDFEPRNEIESDLQMMTVSLFKEYVRSIKDFSSLLKQKQCAETRDSSTSPMHSPTGIPCLENERMQHTANIPAVYHRPEVTSTPSTRRCNTCRPVVNDTCIVQPNEKCYTTLKTKKTCDAYGAYVKPRPECSAMCSVPTEPLSDESTVRTPVCPVDVTNMLKLKNLLDAEIKTKPEKEKQALGNRDHSSRFSSLQVRDHRHSLLMTQSDYSMDSASKLSLKGLAPVLDKVKSEAAFHRPYTQVLWPTDEPIPPSVSNKQVRMTSWLQLRTIPTFEAVPSDLFKKGYNPPTNGISPATKYASVEENAAQMTDAETSTTVLKQQGESELRTLSRTKADEPMIPLISEMNGCPERGGQLKRIPSPCSSELSVQSVLSFIISDGQEEKKPQQFEAVCDGKVKQRNYITLPQISLSSPAGSPTRERSNMWIKFEAPLVRETTFAQADLRTESPLQLFGFRGPSGSDTGYSMRALSGGSAVGKPQTHFSAPHFLADEQRVHNKGPHLHSRHSMFTPSTSIDGILQSQSEINSSHSLSSNVIRRNRSFQCQKSHRPLSLNVESAATKQDVVHLMQQQLRIEKSDSSTQTDELTDDTIVWPIFEPEEDNIATPLQEEPVTTEDWSGTSSPVEMWPLSIQSIVKPVYFSSQLSPGDFRDHTAVMKLDENKPFPSISTPQEDNDEAASVYRIATGQRNMASTDLSRHLSPAALYQASSNQLRPPLNRGLSVMRRTRSPNDIQKYGCSNIEPVRCRSVHFSTDVLVAHTGHGPAPLMLSSAPLKEPATPLDCTVKSSYQDKKPSQRAKRSNSVSMIVSSCNNFGPHRTCASTMVPLSTSFLSSNKNK